MVLVLVKTGHTVSVVQVTKQEGKVEMEAVESLATTVPVPMVAMVSSEWHTFSEPYSTARAVTVEMVVVAEMEEMVAKEEIMAELAVLGAMVVTEALVPMVPPAEVPLKM